MCKNDVSFIHWSVRVRPRGPRGRRTFRHLERNLLPAAVHLREVNLLPGLLRRDHLLDSLLGEALGGVEATLQAALLDPLPQLIEVRQHPSLGLLRLLGEDGRELEPGGGVHAVRVAARACIASRRAFIPRAGSFEAAAERVELCVVVRAVARALRRERVGLDLGHAVPDGVAQCGGRRRPLVKIHIHRVESLPANRARCRDRTRRHRRDRLLRLAERGLTRIRARRARGPLEQHAVGRRVEHLGSGVFLERVFVFILEGNLNLFVPFLRASGRRAGRAGTPRPAHLGHDQRRGRGDRGGRSRGPFVRLFFRLVRPVFLFLLGRRRLRVTS
mmetsp:Transcript_7851/g.35642  ORF Transcript_7851/g.35642 Transcript_7851/m.35642 type:complete len:331 (+) Transcript_7851:503-1495(+)